MTTARAFCSGRGRIETGADVAEGVEEVALAVVCKERGLGALFRSRPELECG